mmetsp:Transcript_9975/g.1561  ORF Transcript_9975/g.1561 Transcript_9975/m.1561 type:complete len:86 (+) Transcript_9975:166-423(+)
MLRDYRKPLIIAGPKTLLRHPECKSSFKEMDEGTQFQEIFVKNTINENTKYIIALSGKIRYSIEPLIKDRSDVAILILDQLLPFP